MRTSSGSRKTGYWNNPTKAAKVFAEENSLECKLIFLIPVTTALPKNMEEKYFAAELPIWIILQI